MRIILKVILTILVLLLIHKPEFIYIPRSINTFFGTVGFLVYLIDSKYRNRIVHGHLFRFNQYAIFYLPTLFMAIFSCLINNPFETYYVTLIFSIFLAYYANYLLARLSFVIYGEYTLRIFIKYFIIAEMIYLTVSIMMFADSSIRDFILSLLKTDIIQEAALERTEGFRIQGFGASFYGAGIVNGFFLIILASCLSTIKWNNITKALLYLLYIVVTVIGMMMARSTMVGALLGVLIIVICFKHSMNEWVKNSITVMIVLGVALNLFDVAMRSASFDIDTLYSFAFEMFVNYAEKGELTTSSSTAMWDMYSTIPTTLKTWLIGDALWMSPDGGYYKHVDIGYLRALWYFGLLGTSMLFLYYYKTIKRTVYLNQLFGKRSRFIALILFVYVLSLNLKGPCDLFYYLAPLIFIKEENEIGFVSPAR